MAQILTDVIISNTKGDEKGDYFWDNGESNLLKSLILYVDLDSTRTPEERNLAAVYHSQSAQGAQYARVIDVGILSGLEPPVMVLRF